MHLRFNKKNWYKIITVLFSTMLLCSCLKSYEDDDVFTKYFSSLLPPQFELSVLTLSGQLADKLNGRKFRLSGKVYKNTVYRNSDEDGIGRILWIGLIGETRKVFWVAGSSFGGLSSGFGFYLAREVEKNRFMIYSLNDRRVEAIVNGLRSKYKRESISKKELLLFSKLKWIRCEGGGCSLGAFRGKEGLDGLLYLDNILSKKESIFVEAGLIDLYPIK